MNKPESLYIHIPFCEHICSYCDFPKLQYFSSFSSLYLKQLKKELDSYHIDHPLRTIYVGGGTPSALSLDELRDLLEMIDPYTGNVIEYTFEANPESLSIDKIKLLKAHKVNRISLGVESTQEKYLKVMNRHHSFLDVRKVIDNLVDEGIDNINVDLILGLPNMNLKDLKMDLDNLLTLPIKHISCYSLTVSPHTAFYINGIKPQDDDLMREYYDFVHYYLLDKGFIHYEVSNWAKEGYMSQHNLTYWKNEEYYGVGLGASGYIDNIRYTNTKSINQYNEGKNERSEEVVDLESMKTYMIMTNLRTIYGLDLKKYQSLFNENLLETKGKEIAELIGNKLIELKEYKIIPTYAGMMVLDQVILALL